MSGDPRSTAPRDPWSTGTAVMDAVYGEGFSRRLPTEHRTPLLTDTVENLFAHIWCRPGLSVRDRRLLVIGATAMLGRPDLIRVQALGGLRNGELDRVQLEEIALHLAYYVGWGNASALTRGFDDALEDLDAIARDDDKQDDNEGERS
jgi:4-carboxymuconolactone decarboxylase